MTAREHLFYGLGIIAYSMARADGAIQQAEKNEIHHMLSEWSAHMDQDFDVSQIIFKIMSDTKPRLDDGFELGIKNIKLGADFLDARTKEHFIYLLKDIAHSFPGVTFEEQALVKKFESELKKLNLPPV